MRLSTMSTLLRTTAFCLALGAGLAATAAQAFDSQAAIDAVGKNVMSLGPNGEKPEPASVVKLSDEELVERWAENVVWQHFSGMTFYEPRLPCDATQIGRFRGAIGEAGVEELLKATIDTAVAFKAIRPVELERLIVDTTVQEKAIAHPVDSRLLAALAEAAVGFALRPRDGKMGWLRLI